MNDQPGTDTSPPRAANHQSVDWKYVIVELGIVTAELFIALTLNSVVEWTHHRRTVQDARRNITRELERNRQRTGEDLDHIQSSLSNVNANISTLHRILAGPVAHVSLSNGIDFDTFDDTAWRTARDTGALSYMPYDEVQRYSDVYSSIEYVNQRALDVVDSQFDAMAPAEMGYDVAQIPPDEIKTMLRGNAQAKIKLETLAQMLHQLDRQLTRVR
jgi:hypothetical protein